MVDEGGGGLEQEIRELEKQRQDVETRLRELAAKERFESGAPRPAGRLSSIPRTGALPQKRFREDEYRPLRSSNFPNKRRFMEEAPARGGPTITSTVVKVSEKDPEKPQPTLVLKNEEDKKRSRNLFGVLMGTLQQFKKETEHKTDMDTKRQEVDQKVESKVLTERNELLERHKKIIQEQKGRELALKEEINKKQEVKELELLEGKWAKHHALLSNFHRTETKPHIYFTFNPKAPPLEIKKTHIDQENITKDDKEKDDRARDAYSEHGSDEEGSERNGRTEDKMDTENIKKEKNDNQDS